MSRHRYTLTPPGTPIARQHGCTCPAPKGSAKLQRAEGCPLHNRRHSFDNDGQFSAARKMEDLRERERGQA